MARRVITHSRRHRERTVVVGNPQEWWSPRSVVDVVIDIDTQAHTYHVRGPNGHLVRVTLTDAAAKIRASTPDGTDLLTHLPPC